MSLVLLMYAQDTLESLCELYSLLKEEDMFTAVWLKRARLPEVSLALTYEQHGFFEQAQLSYEQVTSSLVILCVLLKQKYTKATYIAVYIRTNTTIHSALTKSCATDIN